MGACADRDKTALFTRLLGKLHVISTFSSSYNYDLIRV
jgi:hypothetical protein